MGIVVLPTYISYLRHGQRESICMAKTCGALLHPCRRVKMGNKWFVNGQEWHPPIHNHSHAACHCTPLLIFPLHLHKAAGTTMTRLFWPWSPIFPFPSPTTVMLQYGWARKEGRGLKSYKWGQQCATINCPMLFWKQSLALSLHSLIVDAGRGIQADPPPVTTSQFSVRTKQFFFTWDCYESYSELAWCPRKASCFSCREKFLCESSHCSPPPFSQGDLFFQGQLTINSLFISMLTQSLGFPKSVGSH